MCLHTLYQNNLVENVNHQIGLLHCTAEIFYWSNQMKKLLYGDKVNAAGGVVQFGYLHRLSSRARKADSMLYCSMRDSTSFSSEMSPPPEAPSFVGSNL